MSLGKKKKQYITLVPAYKERFDADEALCVKRHRQILTEGDFAFFVPEGLDTSWYEKNFPGASFMSFPDVYFKGIGGYNRLLLSEGFYQRFSDWEYLLIAQPDAVIWGETDRIPEFIAKGFDYYGAPWEPERRIWEWIFPKKSGFPGFGIRCMKKEGQGITMGNGGFSLRHTAHSRQLIRQYRWRKIYWFFKRNEDIFFGVCGSDNKNDYRLADVATGREFAGEYDLRERAEQGRAPYAVHGYSKDFGSYGEMRDFLARYHIEI